MFGELVAYRQRAMWIANTFLNLFEGRSDDLDLFDLSKRRLCPLSDMVKMFSKRVGQSADFHTYIHRSQNYTKIYSYYHIILPNRLRKLRMAK